jgi:hypothetical protein
MAHHKSQLTHRLYPMGVVNVDNVEMAMYGCNTEKCRHKQSNRHQGNQTEAAQRKTKDTDYGNVLIIYIYIYSCTKSRQALAVSNAASHSHLLYCQHYRWGASILKRPEWYRAGWVHHNCVEAVSHGALNPQFSSQEVQNLDLLGMIHEDCHLRCPRQRS